MKREISKYISILFVFISVTFTSIYSKDYIPGYPFLKIGIGARAVGMGNAYTSIIDNSISTYWNPSGLGKIDKSYIYAQHNKWFIGTSIEHLNLSIPSNIGGFGLSLTYLTSGDIEKRDEYGALIGKYDDADLCLNIAFGRQIIKNMLGGLSFKYVSERVESYSMSCFTIDLGMMYIFNCGLKLGTVLVNLPTQNYTMSQMNPPIYLRSGLSYDLNIKNISIIPTVDLLIYTNCVLYENFGIETTLSEVFSLRFGYRTELGQDCYSTGLGISPHIFKNILRIDYVYSIYSVLGDIQVLSFCYSF